MRWTRVYWRHRAKYTDTFASAREAFQQAISDDEFGAAVTKSITAPGGEVVYDCERDDDLRLLELARSHGAYVYEDEEVSG